MISSMAEVTGRIAVVLPHGALFRMGVEGKIRRHILENDLLEAVIGLGANLFYGTWLAWTCCNCADALTQRDGPGTERRPCSCSTSPCPSLLNWVCGPW